MEKLKQRIRTEGKVLSADILKVNSFLNHQIDVELLDSMGAEFARRFSDEKITRVLTIESSGIAIAYPVARELKVPLVFAKKTKSKNLDGAVYSAVVHSFTRGTDYDVEVSKDFIKPGDRVLIIDDFLANGAALEGLSSIISAAGAVCVGAGIAIEKGSQPGGKLLREKGMRIESLAIVESMSPEEGVTFRN